MRPAGHTGLLKAVTGQGSAADAENRHNEQLFKIENLFLCSTQPSMQLHSGLLAALSHE